MPIIDEFRKNDVGSVIEIDLYDDNVAADISAATTKQLVFKKADNTIITKDASFVTDGTDGKVEYTFIEGDLSIAGIWSVQAIVAQSGVSTLHSSIINFRVFDNLV